MTLNHQHVTISPEINQHQSPARGTVLIFGVMLGVIKIGELYYDPKSYPEVPWGGHIVGKLGLPSIHPKADPTTALDAICRLYDGRTNESTRLTPLQRH